jgi:hypothetical protein
MRVNSPRHRLGVVRMGWHVLLSSGVRLMDLGAVPPLSIRQGAMSELTGSPASPLPLESLTQRVTQRLAAAGSAFDRRQSASRPKARRRKEVSVTAPVPARDPAAVRERACLRAVFHELGDAHRRYRAQTGQVVTPALRAATQAFKVDPSVASLVPVVAFLDELGILAW